MLEQRVLQVCRWRRRIALRWLTSISATMVSKLSGKGGFELRGVVKPTDEPLVSFNRHLALLACCHLLSCQAMRKCIHRSHIYIESRYGMSKEKCCEISRHTFKTSFICFWGLLCLDLFNSLDVHTPVVDTGRIFELKK